MICQTHVNVFAKLCSCLLLLEAPKIVTVKWAFDRHHKFFYLVLYLHTIKHMHTHTPPRVRGSAAAGELYAPETHHTDHIPSKSFEV